PCAGTPTNNTTSPEKFRSHGCYSLTWIRDMAPRRTGDEGARRRSTLHARGRALPMPRAAVVLGQALQVALVRADRGVVLGAVLDLPARQVDFDALPVPVDGAQPGGRDHHRAPRQPVAGV